nr:hypothetical protein [Tanacetum cinerariifolium]
MSPGNICHRDTNYLTEKYVGPTVSLGKVSLSSIPQRQVARERFSQRLVAEKSPEISLKNVFNVVVGVHVLLISFCLCIVVVSCACMAVAHQYSSPRLCWYLLVMLIAKDTSEELINALKELLPDENNNDAFE